MASSVKFLPEKGAGGEMASQCRRGRRTGSDEDIRGVIENVHRAVMAGVRVVVIFENGCVRLPKV